MVLPPSKGHNPLRGIVSCERHDDDNQDINFLNIYDQRPIPTKTVDHVIDFMFVATLVDEP